MRIKLFVGLGNPGKKYFTTRHNIGAYCLNLIANKYSMILNLDNHLNGYINHIKSNNRIIYFFIPNNFMNLNGNNIIKVSNFYKLNIKEILVIHDELNLLPGKFKLKFGGSHGGHNGLKNIINCFNNHKEFYRLSIGIGRPDSKQNISNFVLNIPTETEQQLINIAINKLLYLIDLLIK